MQKEYKTVLKQACAVYEEKKSKFIATVSPVSTEDEALDFINGIRSRYWDASHNVYSYYIAGDNTVQRFSDDGEPAGTAGMPVLEAIKKHELQNIAVVVTRYFGGTLLGASGLVRAYGKSASLGIEAAVIIRKQLCTQFGIIVEYPLFGRLQSLVAAEGYAVKGVSYGQDVEFTIFVPVDEVESFAGSVREATNARALTEIFDDVYITLDLNGKLI